MRRAFADTLPLLCPACAKETERGLELHSLEAPGGGGDELVEGVLRCRGCARTYPVVAGIPVVLRNLAAVEVWALFAGGAPDVLAALAQDGPDGAALPHALTQLSSYLQADASALHAKLAARPRARLVLELGCGVGGGLAQHDAAQVVGLDGNASFLRAARERLAGRALPYARRLTGRGYEPAVAPPLAPRGPVELVLADALDPPFAPGAFDRVVALNLLDNVRSPRLLLARMAQLCADGGELIVASPYAWQDGIVDERLDGERGLRAELAAHGFRAAEEDELPWTLPITSRSAVTYRVHYVRATR